MSVIFFGGKIVGHRCLEAMVAHELLPDFIVYNPEDHLENKFSIKKKAIELNIPHISFKEFIQSPEKYITPPYDLGLSAFCSRLIPKKTIKLFTLGITNLHFSLLPKYKGQYPTVYAIANGDKKTGVTLHWIDQGTDSGNIITQKEVPITEIETGHSLFQKCLDIAVLLFIEQLQFYKTSSWPQDRPQRTEKELENRINFKLPNNGQVDWSWPGEKIYNFLRALYHPDYPMPEIEIANEKFQIIKAPPQSH